MMDYEKLYEDIKSYFEKYLETTDREIALLGLYSAGTHVYMRYRIFPPLHILGDLATGKNRRMDLISPISFNSTIYVSPSISALFRTTDGIEGTICIDECDEFIGKNDMKSFLLAGYQKGVNIARSVKDDSHPKGYRPVNFKIYGPKVIITREGTDDEALNSRFITIICLPLSPDSKVPHTLPEEAIKEGEVLNKRLAEMFSNHGEIKSVEKIFSLKGRDAQIFQCITDVAQIFGDRAISDLEEFIVKDYIPESKFDTSMSLQEELIRAIDDYRKAGNEARIKTILTRLQSISSDYQNYTNKKTAKAIRSLGFKTDTDREGTIVIPNSKLLEILKAKYSIDESIRESKEDDHIEDGVLSDCEASEASGGKSDRERPKRVQTSGEASLSSKKPRGSK